MHQNIFVSLSLVLIIGAGAQWLAWALRLPSILMLLLAGFLAGPVLGVIHPDKILGDTLLPFVSIAVAMILFEGGLTLRFSEIRGTGRVVARLVTIGAVVTWVLSAMLAATLLGLDKQLAALLGAILTVTGPTVVLPMLRHIKPSGAVGSILKWEGIVIDPIGAMLAVLVFETILAGQIDHAARHMAAGVLKTVVTGGGIGALSAAMLAYALHRYWIPDHLRAIVATMFVLAAYVSSNLVRDDSGLLAVTLMGILLANQRYADMRHILEFKENLRTFLLSIVFVLLSARVRIDDMRLIGPSVLVFIGAVIVVIRPIAVLASTVGSAVKMKERLLVAAMAPRGIVAAAVASVFALELENTGSQTARLLVPIVFATIVGTVLFYGLTGGWIARALKLSDPNPQGLLLIGGGRFGVQIAGVLHKAGYRMMLADTNRATVAAAQTAGVATCNGDILAEDTIDKLDLMGIGRLLALTSNHEVNVLAAQRFARMFGRSKVYHLPPRRSGGTKTPREAHSEGRSLFTATASYWEIETRLNQGMVVKATNLSDVFDLAEYQKEYGDTFVPLFIIREDESLHVITVDEKVNPKAGETLVALVKAPPEPPVAKS